MNLWKLTLPYSARQLSYGQRRRDSFSRGIWGFQINSNPSQRYLAFHGVKCGEVAIWSKWIVEVSCKNFLPFCDRIIRWWFMGCLFSINNLLIFGKANSKLGRRRGLCSGLFLGKQRSEYQPTHSNGAAFNDSEWHFIAILYRCRWNSGNTTNSSWSPNTMRRHVCESSLATVAAAAAAAANPQELNSEWANAP